MGKSLQLSYANENAFSFKWKYKKLADVVHVLQTPQNLVISRCCTKIYNPHAQL